MTRKTYSPKVMAELERRFPNERTDFLAEEFGMTKDALHGMARVRGWKKTKEFRNQLNREANKKAASEAESILRIRAQMKGGDRRFIHTGELLIKGNLTIHLQRA